MNYTTNYHLPQWVKEDRIMMEDFNRMCADIETGLVGNRDAAQSGDAAVEERTFRQLCRLAYNHYRLAQTVSPAPQQNGLFFQDAAASSEGITGLELFDGVQCLNYSDGTTAEALYKAIKITSQMSTNGSGRSTPLTFTFTAPCNGVLQRLSVTTTSQCSEPCSVCCGATLEDLTTGKATELTPCTLYFRRGSVTEPEQYLYLDIHFHQSHQYRVTVTPPITTDSFTATVLTNTVVMENHVTGSAGAVTHAFQNPPDNLGMLVVVSFHAGTGVLPVLTRSGEAVPMIWSRDIDGKKEAVFAQSGQVRNGETLQLQFTCPKNGEIVFYDWGIMLL